VRARIALAPLALLPLALVSYALALEPAAITPFSSAEPGAALPSGWTPLTLPRRKPPEFTLVRDDGVTVLRVHSQAAVGSAAFRLDADPRANGRLTWRWKIDHPLVTSRFGTKEGDDFAARVYVSFDVPEASLSLVQRAKMKLAKLVYGADLPAAAICYVWDNRQPVGTNAWNPYTDRLRMVVLESGNARAGEWVSESRDLEADFRATFGSSWNGPMPAINGVAVSSDTDQTLETVSAWFGDLRLEARR
jgi:Protein of unknown function (DUF3047)